MNYAPEYILNFNSEKFQIIIIRSPRDGLWALRANARMLSNNLHQHDALWLLLLRLSRKFAMLRERGSFVDCVRSFDGFEDSNAVDSES